MLGEDVVEGVCGSVVCGVDSADVLRFTSGAREDPEGVELAGVSPDSPFGTVVVELNEGIEVVVAAGARPGIRGVGVADVDGSGVPSGVCDVGLPVVGTAAGVVAHGSLVRADRPLGSGPGARTGRFWAPRVLPTPSVPQFEVASPHSGVVSVPSSSPAQSTGKPPG
ncbi:hypothetical protein [Gordonia paraffinivorans]|uniref:hypothetical protein n=1 Tax=Gordonia paraffinivorans TaxID=175628 RepID=UPI0014612E2D|nr:hypothetical protein [Gordonia paraffinivorans]